MRERVGEERQREDGEGEREEERERKSRGINFILCRFKTSPKPWRNAKHYK